VGDLRIGSDEASDAERHAVDEVLASYGPAVVHEAERMVRSGRERRDERRHLLLPSLHALQAAVGWISPEGLGYVCGQLQVPPAEAYGVATFYDLFQTTDPGRSDDVRRICVDGACRSAGSEELVAELEREGARVERSACLGQCEQAPAEFVQGVGRPDRVPAQAAAVFLPQQGERGLRLLERIGVVDPASLESHLAHGGHGALRRAVELGPEAVVDAVAASGLSGRGGAAFPTGLKWRSVAAESRPTKHIVANCDESEPGTFKDRLLMELDPFALIEAMTVAAFATGATRGWIYVRGEYPLAAERMAAAIGACRSQGLLGEDAAGMGAAFDIELRRGAGSYVCGEETALFNSIEGFRGEPRQKPPFPTASGLFGQPTLVNNPETLLNALWVVANGAKAYRMVGSEDSPGTKLFCVSGAVAVPGVYELPFGTTLAQLLLSAGGATGNLKGILLGGAAGSFVGTDQLDVPLTLEEARSAGLTLGSGAVIVFDAAADMTDAVTRVSEFFRDESCGQCVPCREGTRRQHEVLVELGSGASFSRPALRLLDDLSAVMSDASICGLGHTASAAVQSALVLGLLGAGDE
jgi:NADH-quinone oxidoreductase subunit F